MKSWVRKNKKSFVNSLITGSGAKEHDTPAAFFMAGLPGAGKTEFTINLIEELSLKVVRLDMDEIASHIDTYNPLHADMFREAATDLLNATYDRVVHRKVDFIMDGTFRSDNSLGNVNRALKRGYTVKVLYIYQEPDIAWSFTRAREKVENRAINRDGFLKSYFDIHENIKKLETSANQKLSLDIVIKNINNKVGEWHRNIAIEDSDRLVNVRYTKDELDKVLK